MPTLMASHSFPPHHTIDNRGAVGLERRAARFMVEAGCGCENVGKEVRACVMGWDWCVLWADVFH